MPPKSKTQSRRGDISSMSQSQASASQSKKSGTTALEKEELERLSNTLVKFLLITDHKKLPIKKQDITKHVLKEKKVSKMFPDIVKKTSDKLSQVFGIDLVELPDKKGYILVNKLTEDIQDKHMEWSKEDNCKMGLVTVILSLIFMGGNVIEEGQLWHALRRLGVDPEVPHEVFGDVKKMVTLELVRQGYLETEKVQTSEQPIIEFRWGNRAKHETTKRVILNFVCQVYANEVTPDQWTSQWQDVLASEGVTGEAMPSTSSR